MNIQLASYTCIILLADGLLLDRFTVQSNNKIGFSFVPMCIAGMNEFHKSITCVYVTIAILAMTQGTHKHT